MVHGIGKFREAFKDYTEQYVLIGGSACDINIETGGGEFRATKDLDIVIVIETLSKEFVNSFFDFVKSAGYSHINKSSGKKQFYRFEKPENSEYPYMLELFSRKPNFLKDVESRISSIHITDDVSSLSAILLNDRYYEILQTGSQVVNGISVLNIESLVLFKIKAFIDLSKRKAQGENIDSKGIRKHKNDIFRLASMFEPNLHKEITGEVLQDFEYFLNLIRNDPVNLNDLGINFPKEDLLIRLQNCFLK